MDRTLGPFHSRPCLVVLPRYVGGAGRGRTLGEPGRCKHRSGLCGERGAQRVPGAERAGASLPSLNTACSSFLTHYSRNRGANRRGSSGHSGHSPQSVAARISLRKRFVLLPCSVECYGFGEMPSPNHKGWGTSRGSHGDDTESDGACLTGLQPYEGHKREFPRCVAGSLRVRVGTSKASTKPKSHGGIPPRLRGGGGQCCRQPADSVSQFEFSRTYTDSYGRA